MALDADGFRWRGRAYPWPEGLKDRTLYRCDGDGSDGDERAWAPVQAFGHALVKLVPTDWGAPTFEIDGIKMLPTAQVSPWEDAGRKVALVQPRIILAMGRFAVQALLQSTEPLGKLRGQVHQYEGVPVIVTYHPAYLLRSPADKAKAWADLVLALQTVQAT